MSEFDYKQPVTTDAYREGIERIFGKKKRPERESDREKKELEEAIDILSQPPEGELIIHMNRETKERMISDYKNKKENNDGKKD